MEIIRMHYHVIIYTCYIYILVKGTITIAPVPQPAVNPNNNNKEVVFKIVAHSLILLLK